MQINNIANNKLNKANSIGFQSSKLKTMLDSLKLKKQEKDSVELSEDKKQKKEKQKKFAKLMAIVGLVTSGAFLLMSVLRKRKLSTSDISKTFPSFDNSKLSTSDTSKTFASFDNSKLIENIPSSEDLLKSLDDDLSKIGLDLAFDEDKIAKDELREIVNKFLEKDVFIWKSKQDVVESICSDDRKIHFINLINGYNQKSSVHPPGTVQKGNN